MTHTLQGKRPLSGSRKLTLQFSLIDLQNISIVPLTKIVWKIVEGFQRDLQIIQ